MCGRYWLKDNPEELARIYGAKLISGEMKTGGEIFPSYFVPVVKAGENTGAEEELLLSPMKWGFPLKGKKSAVINARSETVTSKNMFNKKFEKQRCIVPVNGFFEWKEELDANSKKRKIKHLFTLPGEKVFSLAGIFGEFYDEGINTYSAFVIITTEPNTVVATVHKRMPVILPKDQEKIWLNNKEHDNQKLMELMVPYELDILQKQLL